jgi:3-oxoacyl-[acyl-carrier protein] reductase
MPTRQVNLGEGSRLRLKNKVCVVTGAGRGIGEATVQKFVTEGAQVLACDMDAAALAEMQGRLNGDGNRVLSCVVDVTDRGSIDLMVEQGQSRFGRIDVLVNNAGIVADAQLRKMSDAQFDRVIDINLKGSYNCARAVVEVMIAQGGGVILNASSIVGLYGNFGQTNYAASKFGVIGMVKTWARELGKHGIRANAVCPGFIETQILSGIPDKVRTSLEQRVPLGRLGKAEEVANLYAFLASDEASYINGAVIEVSGGLTI